MRIYCILFIGIFMLSCNATGQEIAKEKKKPMFNIEKSSDEWKLNLSEEEYKVLRQCGTEPPGTGKYYNFYEEGSYQCAACNTPLFSSKTKYSSGSGWPSFYDVVNDTNVVLIEDKSHGMIRTEVKCANCGGHLGHVFPDGPAPTNLRYCINSVAMQFVSDEENSKK